MKIFKTSIIFFLIFFSVNCNKQSSEKAILVIHGGAGWISKGTISEELENEYKLKLKESLIAGRKILNNKGSSLDAVQASIRILEDSHLFNAGKGSVFTHDEKIEMDSSIMDGYSGNAGSVSGITTIKNPIDLAREILDNSVHVFLSGKGAEDFAIERGLVKVDESYFFTKKNYDKLIQVKMVNQDIKEEKIGTVGAVAIDFQNNISAGTSTGGMTNKRYGRVGDVPVIGAGTYAENGVCGISATGHGEFFIRNVVAYDIAARIKYKNENIQKASREVIENLKSIGGLGGVIGLDQNKNVVMPFNTKGMFRGYISEKGEPVVMIYGDQN